MYKKALKDLIDRAAVEFFKEHTKYKMVCCYKVTFRPDNTMLNFTAHIAAADKDPQYGEYFEVEGWTSYDIEFSKITNKHTGRTLYNRWARKEA